MKIIIFILVIMCPQIVFSSDKLDALDGKNIICQRTDKTDFPNIGIYGFRFIGNEVSGDYFVVENDTVKIFNFNTDIIKSITVDTIIWWGGEITNGWKLNRETLYLVYDDDLSPHQCRVVSNINEYNNEMELIRLEYFEILKDKLKKNKI